MPSLHTIASSITKTASKQTYYTIRFLADRERVADAYRAYAYFRWVDDMLDSEQCPACSGAWGVDETEKRILFLERQKSLLETCYRGEAAPDTTLEENMLVELVKQDDEKNSGLQSYLRNMMRVMEFDARRRGRFISYSELNQYTRWLATAVTEAMHYFIGHCCSSPHNELRYLAVSGAHITHMLRDTFEDVQTGYYNIPREVLEPNHIRPMDIHSEAYRTWVQSRVQLARQCFKAGRDYLAQVENSRCRLAGLAYAARFEWLLNTIERENYYLRPSYAERKSARAGLQIGRSALSALVGLRKGRGVSQPVVSHSLRKL